MTDENDPATQAVSWYGAEEYDGQIRYGKLEAGQDTADPQELKMTAEAEVTEVREDEYYRYKAVLEDLEPSSSYGYQVGQEGGWSQVKRFTTAPAPAEKSSDGSEKGAAASGVPESAGTSSLEAASGAAFSCLYMGDIQYQVREEDYKAWGERLKKAFEENPKLRFGLFSGDMVEKSGDTQDWTSFFTESEAVFSRIPMATVPGNHETSVIPYTYLQMLPVPEDGPVKGEVYSFDYGSCHFTMLNSCLFMDERIRDMGQEAWDQQMEAVKEWLKKDLAESGAEWKIAVLHHPPYPAEEDDEIYSRIRESWGPIFESAGTDLVLCGHQHCYMRTREIGGVTYIMGNAGEKQSYYYEEGTALPEYVEKLEDVTGTYQIITVSEKQLKVEAFDRDGKRLDTWKKVQEN